MLAGAAVFRTEDEDEVVVDLVALLRRKAAAASSWWCTMEGSMTVFYPKMIGLPF